MILDDFVKQGYYCGFLLCDSLLWYVLVPS